MQFKDIYSKYKDVIPYAVFGVLTTIVNIATYYVSAHIMRLTVMASTFIAWVLAVLFAYITNRRWVFHSEVHAIADILTEMIAFFSCRLATGCSLQSSAVAVPFLSGRFPMQNGRSFLTK